MKNKWRMPHPATMFLLLTMAVVFLSWICDIYGLKVTLPQTGEDIRVQSLLSPEGIRWWLRNAIKNFTGFAPLGMVIIAMFGLGVAQHSGFIDACIRMGVGNRQEKRKIILWVIVLGLLSNAIGDGGYIILLPIAAMLFQWVGLHPIAGIVTAYVSVACGYSANIVLSTMDPLLAHTTQEAALAQTGYQGNTEPLCNYFFMSASTVVITAIVYWITQKWLLPTLGKYEGSESGGLSSFVSQRAACHYDFHCCSSCLCRSYLVAYFFFLWNFARGERRFDAFAFYCRYFVLTFFGSRYYRDGLWIQFRTVSH